MVGQKISDAVELKLWELHKDGVSQRKIAKELGISTATVSKYVKIMKKDDYEPPQVSLEELEALEEQVDENMSRDQKMEKAFDLAIDMLYLAVNKGKEGWIIEDERKVRIPIKTVMDCIEKAGKHAKTMSEAAKAAKAGLSPKTIDYKKMAEMYISFNKETGKFDYDAKKHMQEVLNTAHSKEK